MAISGTTSGPELLVELDRTASEPLHRQLANGLRDAIRTGRSAPATRLPSTRALAEPHRAPPGLMLGYANLTESQIVTGVQALPRAIVEAR
jgi:DNA-binding transcriptional regulator YhcF (GntR family)